MTAKSQARAILKRFDVHLTHYHWTYEARRQLILESRQIDLLVDVGANTGQYAHAVRLGGYRGHIISYEPVSECFPGLLKATKDDPNWTARQLALGSEPGELVMHLGSDNFFTSALPIDEHGLRMAPGALEVGTETVPVSTLDAELAEYGQSRIGIKIDVQGFERQVLDGGQESLARAGFLELELTPTTIYPGQELLLGMLNYLAERGFVLALVENILPLPDATSGQFNGIFVKR